MQWSAIEAMLLDLHTKCMPSVQGAYVSCMECLVLCTELHVDTSPWHLLLLTDPQVRHPTLTLRETPASEAPVAIHQHRSAWLL